MEKTKFEVGKKYYNNSTKRKYECTKRSEKSVWFGNYRFLIKTRYGIECIDGALTISADNIADDEVQRVKALERLQKAIKDVLDLKPAECDLEMEEEIYDLCGDLDQRLEDYIRVKENKNEI